ncbi:MAG: RNA-binding S4 domain-containing protein [Microbacteriaceae bacterium]|nr:RNA-binding S4 domain-containing protein [Microbacteriaceae bacterium]
MESAASVRIDSWAWAVRLAKTRSAAASACRGGHVRVNGDKAKPAQQVRVGDEVRARVGDVERIVVVSRLITKRVGAIVAVDCYLDKTPVAPPREETPMVAQRDRGAGRPTKRERRDIDRLLGFENRG